VQEYDVEDGRRKRVHYWVGRAVGGDDVTTYQRNDEIDDLAWVTLDEARHRLSYDHDRALLEEATSFAKRTVPLVVLRHGRARIRRTWAGDDRDRPLTRAGEFQAEQLAPLLGAYGVTHVLTSSSRRCWTTVAPYAEVADVEIEDTDDLSQEDATPELATKHVQALLARKEPSVLCTHRPVLPWVFEALDLEPRELATGAAVVVHHRNGRVVATEEHEATFQ
jgi:phosphohistidine phosphatase SixA